MLRSLSLGLLASAISVASLPAIAQEDGGAALLRQQRDKLLEEIELLKQRKEQLEAQISGSAQGKDDAFDLQEISLNDAVKFNWGFQGALQGAGTPNQAGLVGSCLSLLETTAFGFLISWLTPTSLITAMTAA